MNISKLVSAMAEDFIEDKKYLQHQSEYNETKEQLMRFGRSIAKITDNIVDKVMETVLEEGGELVDKIIEEIKKSDFIDEIIEVVTEAVMEEIVKALGGEMEDEEEDEDDEEKVLDMRRVGEDLDDEEFGIN